jgi:hypothetical protein
MIRCATLAVALFACALPVAAQMQRNFPANALRGELLVLQPPDAQLNGRPARLAPGARIRGDNNLLVVSGAIAHRRLRVHYTLDTGGQLLDVWVLTAAELARPWPSTPEQARAWAFDPATQAWSRP